MAETIPTASSGREVPKATNDNPITEAGTLYFLAILIAESTSKSAPNTKHAIPIIININEIVIE